MNVEKVIKRRELLANQLNKANGKILSRIIKVFKLYRAYKLENILDNYPDDADAIFKWENIEYVDFSISRGGFSINCITYDHLPWFGDSNIYHTIRINDISILEMNHREMEEYIIAMINHEYLNLLSMGRTKL